MSNAPILLEVQCIACDRTLQKIKHNPANFLAMMKNASGRRMRTPNWSLQEKQYLLELIKEKKNVVAPNNIGTGSNHSEEKTAAWNDIMRRLTDKFGSKFAGSTIKKVKTQWQNMKRIAREEFSARVVSQQSMEVCKLLEGQVAGDVMKDEDDDDASTTMEIKQESLDVKKAEASITIDVTSEKSTSSPKRSSTKKASPTTSPALSEYIRFSDTDEPLVMFHNRQENASRTSSNPNTIQNLSPDNAMFNRARDGDTRRSGKNTAAEIKLKLEMMKEERQVLRAMRETAELNKVIAEQRLKHMLWIKKQEQGMYSGEPGSGAGRGGGGGGAIRDAGGAFGKMEAGREEEYFYRQQREQLQELKTHLKDEISFHEEEIRRHQEAIQRHKSKVTNIEQTNN